MYPQSTPLHKTIRNYVIGILTLVGTLIVLGMYGCPYYNVWEQGLAGQAELAKAEQNRKIRTLEAQQKKESAALEADAEVARAEGLAKANKILGDSLRGEQGERYLRYLWITSIKGSGHETIYIPTEANIPIMEAGRFARPTPSPTPSPTPTAR